ncbi:MAG: archease [Thermofilaceae archaeon]|nr:archease [Thermofilaceae archaeon]
MGVELKGGFRHLPHTADVLIEAWGRSLEEAFEYAALGVFEVMTDTTLVQPRVEVKVTAQGFDLESLLYDWIEQLLVLFDTRQLLFSKFKVEGVREDLTGNLQLEARAWGEEYDPSRHESRTLIKAMTYHAMEIKKEEGFVQLRFVVDI